MQSRQNGGWLVFCTALCLVLPSLAGAEFYIAGQVGATFPQDFSVDEAGGLPTGETLSNLRLKDSVVYGGKLGYFFPRLEWLGIETEAYTTTPHLKSQVVQVTGPLGTQNIMIQGKHLGVTTLAFNLIARYPAKRVRPYAGAGLGIFFLGVPGTEKDLDTAPGLNVFAGLRFLVTSKVAVFAEYKFNRVTFDVDSVNLKGLGKIGLEGDYQVHHLVAGISFHFRSH